MVSLKQIWFFITTLKKDEHFSVFLYHVAILLCWLPLPQILYQKSLTLAYATKNIYLPEEISPCFQRSP